MAAERQHPASSTTEPPRLPSPGEIANGRYEVRQELGRGGMAVVLAARDRVLQRDVALKMMLPVLMASSEAVERFVNEARSLAQLDSPHVVRVLDCGRLKAPVASAGLPFMVLELLRGEDLYSVAARQGGLSPERVVRYALQACAGLAAAHAQGIVHRDLKPENLFLAQDAQGNECLKVLDFGIARSHSRRALTRGKFGLGSPGYISPEQLQDSSVIDARSDIWGLGVVMYELLAHRPAFTGDDPLSLYAQTLTASVVPLGELRPDVPSKLIEAVERCLERDPERRFGSVQELAEALARLQAPDDIVVELAPSDIVELEGPISRRPRARRVAAWALAAMILAPSVALLPRVAEAPELAPARAWTTRNIERAKGAWEAVRDRAHRWLERPTDSPTPRKP